MKRRLYHECGKIWQNYTDSENEFYYIIKAFNEVLSSEQTRWKVFKMQKIYRRRIVIAYYFENRKQADISRELGIPFGTVKWQVISVILFGASLLSILWALALVSVVSNVNNLFIENMWLFFLMLGSNDSKKNNWDKEKYRNDLGDIIDSYLALNV